jgi:hypothetical protein
LVSKKFSDIMFQYKIFAWLVSFLSLPSLPFLSKSPKILSFHTAPVNYINFVNIYIDKKKKNVTKMSLGEFFADESTGGSSADEFSSLPSACKYSFVIVLFNLIFSLNLAMGLGERKHRGSLVD